MNSEPQITHKQAKQAARLPVGDSTQRYYWRAICEICVICGYLPLEDPVARYAITGMNSEPQITQKKQQHVLLFAVGDSLGVMLGDQICEICVICGYLPLEDPVATIRYNG